MPNVLFPNEGIPPKPCEFFHLIGGTSTGGLIAIMLGRLKLDIATCIKVYLELSETVFQPNRIKNNWFSKTIDKMTVKGRFSSTKLTEAIKKVIREHSDEGDDAALYEKDDPACRVFVCATRADSSKPVKFRSYRSETVDEVMCTIWEASRATSAASTFFDPISIGPFRETFVDGATGVNNPVEEAYQEARLLWPGRDIECLISLGTGDQGVQAFGTSNVVAIVETLKRISTETAETAEKFQKTVLERSLQGKYYRFNVIHGLESISLEEYKQQPRIAAATKGYLSETEIFHKIGQLAAIMDVTSTDESANVDLCIDSFRLSGQGKTQSCLNEVVDHLHGTLQWLQFEKSIIAFTQTLDSPVLHIVGKCGSGKSVISKRLYKIMTLDRRGAIIPIFFTFHASKAARQTLSDFLNFCILRIIETRKSMIHHVMPLWEEREQHVHGTSSWTEAQLLRILSILILENLEEHVVLVLDQLDQCQGIYNNVLRTLLRFFEDLQCRRHGCVQFVFSSQSSSLPVIPQQDYLLLDLDKAAGTQQDIEIYVRHQVRTKLEARYSDKLEQLIITELTRRADGMYIFVTPIVDLLSRNTDSSIKRVTDLIRSLPDNVSGLYRILWNNVMKQDRPRAARILAMTMHSTTPFLPTQLSEAIGVMQAEDEELGSPELLTEPENIVQDLVYLLGPFLRFEKTVDISHPSMKDFFTDPNRPPFEDESEYPELAQSDLAHALLGRICLRALVCRPFDRGLSFSLYAIHSFPKHIRLACESQTPELWHYLSSFFSTERRRNNGNAYNFFWRQFVRCQRTWGDVDVRDFTDDTQAFPMLGRLLRRQSSESDLERDVIVRHVTRMMGTQDPDDAMTDEPVFSARVSLNQSISFLCMNDVPHMLVHAARIRIASGEFTLKDLFCHVTESLQYHSLRCLDVLGDLFNLLQPVQLFDATRMLNDTYYKQDFVSGIPSTLVRPSHNSSGHDGHTKEVDQSPDSCFRPQIDSIVNW